MHDSNTQVITLSELAWHKTVSIFTWETFVSVTLPGFQSAFTVALLHLLNTVSDRGSVLKNAGAISEPVGGVMKVECG